MAHALNTLAACGLALSAGLSATAAYTQSSPYYFGGGLGIT